MIRHLLLTLLILSAATMQAFSTADLLDRFFDSVDSEDYEQSAALGEQIHRQWDSAIDSQYCGFLYFYAYSCTSRKEYVTALDVSQECVEAISQALTPDSAVVYGGIRYDAAASEAVATTAQQRWDYLPGTLAEAHEVATIMHHSGGHDVALLTGDQATERSIRNLSGLHKQMLHIATHGFYYTSSDESTLPGSGKPGFLLPFDERPGYVEDQTLARSGIIFAGAHGALGEAAAGSDDGVLTAQEIARLDLSGLDMLVLSACQTGLGDVRGDGVFGLQRGFKRAGAQTIMMSLWPVSDAATVDMMSQFYSALAAGKSKHEAYVLAQQYVRQHAGGYPTAAKGDKRPQWAAFVLLDAR